MYDQERFSNNATTAKPAATQPIPSSAPAAVPHKSVVFESARNTARFADITNAKKNAPPKARALLKFLTCASVNPFARSQTLPNAIGEYHNPPMINADS